MIQVQIRISIFVTDFIDMEVAQKLGMIGDKWREK